VEKYDFIGAPWDRAIVEAAFYRKVSGSRVVAGGMPRFVAADGEARVLVLEDLGTASDLTGVYADGGKAEEGVLRELGRWLRRLHEEFAAPPAAEAGVLSNREMRALNHAYIFDLPLKTSAGDAEKLGAGLGAVVEEMRADAAYGARVEAAGREYLTADGPSLLHGDFFPGSWLMTAGGVRVIDPEFAYYGRPEFDVGVCLGHLALARQPEGAARAFLEGYGAGGLDGGLDGGRIAVTAGIEVMRRLIGVAQLPLGRGVDKAGLLRKSYRAVMEGKAERLFDGGSGGQG
jgi:5-methylthioribose kinase